MGSRRRSAVNTPYTPFTNLEKHIARTVEAAYHVADREGSDAVRVLAEWVIERESIFNEVEYYAHPIIRRLQGWEPGGSFGQESTPGVKRIWIWRLAQAIQKGKASRDWRTQVDRPLSILDAEREELEMARQVCGAVKQWLAVGDGKGATLVQVEKRLVDLHREYERTVEELGHAAAH